MASVTIYTKPACPYCVYAKALLRKKGAKFNEISVEANGPAAAAMIQRSGRRTVPQIYIGEYHVGGFTDLQALEDDGRLEALLNGPSQT